MAKSWKNPVLLARFAQTVTADEIERHLSGDAWDRLLSIGHWRNRLHVHHVFHAGTRKDLWWNLVRASEAAHAYAHANPVGGMLASMYAELRRSTPSDRGEIREQWQAAFGRDAVGWVQAKMDGGYVLDCYHPLAEAILEFF